MSRCLLFWRGLPRRRSTSHTPIFSASGKYHLCLGFSSSPQRPFAFAGSPKCGARNDRKVGSLRGGRMPDVAISILKASALSKGIPTVAMLPRNDRCVGGDCHGHKCPRNDPKRKRTRWPDGQRVLGFITVITGSRPGMPWCLPPFPRTGIPSAPR